MIKFYVFRRDLILVTLCEQQNSKLLIVKRYLTHIAALEVKKIAHLYPGW